jgi:predicted RNA-binding Zn ribbon-like protein
VIEQTETRFLYVANSLCLDLVNTEVMSGGEMTDLLRSFSDLVAWLRGAGALDTPAAAAAEARWGGTRDGARTLEGARAFRSVLRGMAERMAAGRAVRPAVVDAVNAVLRLNADYTQVVRTPGGFAEETRWAFERPDQLLAPVARSAADLLGSGDHSLVRKCRNPRCVLFFYDTTKNHGRAWCSMSACGNRTKVAAHYKRRRAVAAEPDA